MGNSIYSANFSGIDENTHARIGKIASAVGTYVEAESDLLRKKGTLAETLFNVQKSNNPTEATVIRDELDTMDIVEEGDKAPVDSYKELRVGYIGHHQFMKTVNITETMIEDSKFAEMKSESENMVRAYYATRNKFAAYALLSALSGSFKFGGKTHATKTPDGVSLCNVAHLYSEDDLTQSNRFSNVRGSGVDLSSSYIKDALMALKVKGRMLKTEQGDPTGYTFNTIIIPGNRDKLEEYVKSAVGSERIPGKDFNDINTQYGLWNVIVIPIWETTADEFYVMSTDANQLLNANQFYDRVPLSVRGNYVYNSAIFQNTARARMGVGFGNYKHILHFESLANGQSTLVDGGTAGTNSTAITL